MVAVIDAVTTSVLQAAAAAAGSTLVYRDADNDRTVEIRAASGLRWLCIGGSEIQSAIRLDAPDELVLPNHHYLLAALAWCAHPPRVLNLGFGGGAIERFFSARWPRARVTSVEIDARIIDLARRYFYVPDDWPVTVAAAADYLRTCTASYDLIVCDIYGGEAHPPCLSDGDFYAAAARCLNTAGVLVLNLSPGADRDLLDLLVVMRTRFSATAIAKVPDTGNVVVVLGRDPHLDLPPPDDRVVALSRLLDVDMAAIVRRFQRLPSTTEAHP